MRRNQLIQKHVYFDKWRVILHSTRSRLDSLIRFILSRHFRRWRIYCKLIVLPFIINYVHLIIWCRETHVQRRTKQ